MKHLLLILILLSSVTFAYAGEPQICFEKEDAANIVVILEKYDICTEKEGAYINIQKELNKQIQVLTDYNITLEDQIKNSDEIIKDKDGLLSKQEEVCRIEVEAAKPTWGDRSMWAGAGALIVTILLLAL